VIGPGAPSLSAAGSGVAELKGTRGLPPDSNFRGSNADQHFSSSDPKGKGHAEPRPDAPPAPDVFTPTTMRRCESPLANPA